MQQNNIPEQSLQNNRIRPARLIKHPRHFLADGDWGTNGSHTGNNENEYYTQNQQQSTPDVASLPTGTLQHSQSNHVSSPSTPPVIPATPTFQRSYVPNTPSHPFSPMHSFVQPLQGEGALPTTPRPDPDSEFFDDDFDISNISTMQLMRLSGMMRAVQVPQRPATMQDEDGYWPNGIRQTGPFPVVNVYGREPFGRTLPTLPVPQVSVAPVSKVQPRWKMVLNSPAVKVILGLIIGVGMLYIVTKFINVSDTINILRRNLTTPRGIMLALLTGASFLTAFAIRGLRWKLFLNPIGKVSAIKAIQLFLIGMFLNFILPVRGGEVAKSLMLKRIANIPISRSLPTVAMDKALDLMPALFIMAIVPLLGISMDIKLWLILGAVGGLLVCLIFFIALAAWKRSAAIALLEKMTRLVPGGMGNKIADFATGFVDSLLAGASQPKIFLPAVGLTIIAVIFDGLFAMLAFWTIGLNIPFGTALFGYTVYNMYYILPTPPGEVGSNEIVGLLVFHGLLQQPAASVTAMFVFSHPLTALLMTVSGLIGLSGLGLTLSGAMKVQTEGSKGTETEQLTPPLEQGQVVRA